MSRSAFAKALRNPVYCGKIFIEDNKQEEAYYSEGKHEALISERLFYQVKQVMDKKERLKAPVGEYWVTSVFRFEVFEPVLNVVKLNNQWY